jgi:hypothetical protein
MPLAGTTPHRIRGRVCLRLSGREARCLHMCDCSVHEVTNLVEVVTPARFLTGKRAVQPLETNPSSNLSTFESAFCLEITPKGSIEI